MRFPIEDALRIMHRSYWRKGADSLLEIESEIQSIAYFTNKKFAPHQLSNR
jgi:hypothetical protein